MHVDVQLGRDCRLLTLASVPRPSWSLRRMFFTVPFCSPESADAPSVLLRSVSNFVEQFCKIRIQQAMTDRRSRKFQRLQVKVKRHHHFFREATMKDHCVGARSASLPLTTMKSPHNISASTHGHHDVQPTSPPFCSPSGKSRHHEYQSQY